MSNPSDSKVNAESVIHALGGQLQSYYWGANDAKNYITLSVPADDTTVIASLILRLSSGLMASYHAIELLPSDKLPACLERVEELRQLDHLNLDTE